MAADQLFGATQGIDLLLKPNSLDAIVAPTGSPAWTTDLINSDHFLFASSTLAAIVGYPIINVPMGNVAGLPMGISFIGAAFSKPTLIKLASGFEHVTNARIVPQFLPTIPGNQGGTTLVRRQSSPGHQKPHSLGGAEGPAPPPFFLMLVNDLVPRTHAQNAASRHSGVFAD